MEDNKIKLNEDNEGWKQEIGKLIKDTVKENKKHRKKGRGKQTTGKAKTNEQSQKKIDERRMANGK